MNFCKTLFATLAVGALFLMPVAAGAQSVPESAFMPGEAEDIYGDQAFVQQEPQYQSEEVTGRITEIISTSEIDGVKQALFKVTSNSGEEFTVNTSESYTEGLRYKISVGDVVYLQVLRSNDTGEVMAAYLADVRRTNTIAWLIVLFCALVIAVGWMRGVSSLFGLFVTLAILFLFVFPQILHGADAVLVTVIGSIVILGVNMHLSHGFNRGTILAFASTVVGLLLSLIFAKLFVHMADLSGLASEESALLYYTKPDIIFPSGILLSGIILGAVGVLDDIAITQSETVAELIKANDSLDRKELFIRAMRVGRHHIASTVNTLVLAYVGVAMPLLLLFIVTPEITTMRFLNQEPVAEEIVRTLAGTMALILTVPVSTLFATFVKKR